MWQELGFFFLCASPLTGFRWRRSKFLSLDTSHDRNDPHTWKKQYTNHTTKSYRHTERDTHSTVIFHSCFVKLSNNSNRLPRVCATHKRAKGKNEPYYLQCRCPPSSNESTERRMIMCACSCEEKSSTTNITKDCYRMHSQEHYRIIYRVETSRSLPP